MTTDKKPKPTLIPKPAPKKVLDPEEVLIYAKKTAAEMQSMYRSDPKQKGFTALILGEIGSGKSFLLRTARKPVHVDSFDPGGTVNLQPEIDRNLIIPDVRFEYEDPSNPSVFSLWMRVMEERIREGYFNHIGTYCIDSATNWSEAIMNWVLKKVNLAGEAPRWAHDYVPQKVEMRNWIRKCIDLPCDFFMTGHLEAKEDKVTKQIYFRFMTTGKGVVTLPALFDEVYIMLPKSTSQGVEYQILTKSTGTYVARSRLAKLNLLDQYEKPDIKHILKKARMPTEDKPLLV